MAKANFVRDGAHGCIQSGTYGNLAFLYHLTLALTKIMDYHSAPKPEEGAVSSERQTTNRTQILRQSLYM